MDETALQMSMVPASQKDFFDRYGSHDQVIDREDWLCIGVEMSKKGGETDYPTYSIPIIVKNPGTFRQNEELMSTLIVCSDAGTPQALRFQKALSEPFVLARFMVEEYGHFLARMRSYGAISFDVGAEKP